MEALQTNVCLSEALKHFDAGRAVVPCSGKRPAGADWGNKWRDRARLAGHFDRHPKSNLGLVLDGQLVDIEWDSPEQEQAFRELFEGIDVPQTPCFSSPRGTHHFFTADKRLTDAGLGVVNYKKLGIRIGAGGLAVQTVIPPSANPDGTRREWTVSFDDCDPAPLPAAVVDRILEYVNRAPAAGGAPQESPRPAGASVHSQAIAAMLNMPVNDQNDGSRRLYNYACRAVEHDLTDETAIAAVREVEKIRPFPRRWSDAEITQRVRDAERDGVTRGLATTGLSLSASRTDSANALRLAKQFGDSVRWCDPWKKWLVWDGGRWLVDERCAVEGFAQEVAHDLWQEAGEDRKKIAFVQYSNSYKGVCNMCGSARNRLAINPHVLDSDPFAFNVANGTIDLRSGQPREHRQADYITKQSSVAYDPQADCSRWREFLESIFAGDAELIAFVQRLSGYCLTGDVREQILPILYGTGSNGKTTLLNVLLDVMGDYAIKASEGVLMKRRNAEHPTGLADLAGKRLAVASETNDGACFDEARIKELTGGEKVRARRMRENFWEFTPSHKLLVATNHKPPITGTDNAIWRRMLLIPFNVTIANEQQDKTLPGKLRAEYPGILRWMIEGCLAWQGDGLGVPEKVRSATASYRSAEDVLGAFIDAECELDPQARVGATQLLDAYHVYSGDRAMTARKLASLLTERGFVSVRITGGRNRGRMGWAGLAHTSEG